jgi:phosphate-selective porin OprO/OprP
MTLKRCRLGLPMAGVLVLGLCLAGNAFAQGMYLKEIEKDGRIYLFNDAKRAENFEAGGEMGVGISRVGDGPNGETLVADSEAALDLYFFKHGIAKAVERPAAPVQKVEWRDGKTRFTLGKQFYMEWSNRIQPRFTYEMPADSILLPGTGTKGTNKGSFRMRRAKSKFEGWIYKPEIEFEVQFNWPDVNNTPPSQLLEDAALDWDISKKKCFRFRFGQFKAPFGRQQLTSSGAQQFVDRAIQDARYNDARETGVAVWGTLYTNKIDWRAMMSNGNGRSQIANENNKFLYSGRVMWQALGNTRMNQWGSGALLTEGDLGDSQNGPLLALAANVSNNDHDNATAGNDLDNTTVGFDSTFKHKGFASVAEYAYRESRPETGPYFADRGFLVQASYARKAPGIIGGSFWEIAGRYAQVDPSDLVTNNLRKEIGGCLNYYYNKHNFKLQADFRSLEDEAGDSGRGTTSYEGRFQTQYIF